MSNSLILFIIISASLLFMTSYLEIEETKKVDRCYDEIERISICIEQAWFKDTCQEEVRELISIKGGYIFCGETYHKSKYPVNDVNGLSNKILCEKNNEVVECSVI